MIKLLANLFSAFLLASCASSSEVRTEKNTFVIDTSIFNLGNKGATADALRHAINLSKEYCAKKLPGGESKILRVVELAEGSHGGKIRLYFDCIR